MVGTNGDDVAEHYHVQESLNNHGFRNIPAVSFLNFRIGLRHPLQ
jgi:hypothetical protein